MSTYNSVLLAARSLLAFVNGMSMWEPRDQAATASHCTSRGLSSSPACVPKNAVVQSSGEKVPSKGKSRSGRDAVEQSYSSTFPQ